MPTLRNRFARHGLLPALACALIALAPVAGHAALFEDDEARRALIELRAKFNEQSRQIDALNKQVAELQNRLEQRIEPAMRSQLDTQNQMEALRQDIARLRGQLEVQTNELTTVQRKQRETYADIDSRVKRFEPTQVQLDGKTVAVDPSEKRGYEAALAQFRAGDFRAAQTAFQALLTQNPESAYAPNAMFWMGSAQFAQKDYKGAISTHHAFVTKFPDHPRVPDALLNQAYAQIESGDRKTARTTLQNVIAKYGDTSAGQAARDRLASLK